MKKSLFNIILLVLLVTNLALTVIIVFAVVPSVKNSSDLVGKVAAAIDLEKEGRKQHVGEGQISIDDTDIFTFADKFTVELNPGSDGKSHIAVFKLTLTLDKSNEDYEKYKEKLSDYEELMRTKVSGIVSKYSETEAVNNKEQILEEIKDVLREMYNNSTFIYSVGFGDFMTQ